MSLANGPQFGVQDCCRHAECEQGYCGIVFERCSGAEVK
jgi:hypothetical protein